MTKVLFILSAVVILVSSFFAYQNGRAFTDVRTKVAGLANQINAEMKADKVVVDEVGKLGSSVATVTGELDVETEKLKAQKNKLAQAENEAARTEEEYKVKDAKKQELAEQLAKLPKDMKVETLAEDMARLKKEKVEFEAQAEIKKKEVVTEEEKVAGVQKRLDDVVHKIEDRRKNFERNSLAARVLAVNHDWGFVVIDAGRATGLTEETKLIVTRGALTVGKISVMSVESGRAMASIVPNTVANGNFIMPGDRVILENLVQN